MNPTFTVTIDRTSLGKPDLVIPGLAAAVTALGLVSWDEPAMRAEIDYAPDDMFTHGSRALGWRWGQTALNFDVTTRGATSEAAARALHAELLEALTQWMFPIHLDPDGAARETWTCDPGSLVPAASRSRIDLTTHDVGWACSVPADPVRSVA